MELVQKAKKFLKNNRLAMIATIDNNNLPQAAVVYYSYEDGKIHFVTERSSKKAENIVLNKNVALVIVQERHLEMLQIEGEGEMLSDSDERVTIAMKIYGRLHEHNPDKPWPVIKAHPQNLEVFEVSINKFKYSHFADENVEFEGTANDWYETPVKE